MQKAYAMPEKGTFYRHFRGGKYLVLAPPRDTDTGAIINFLNYSNENVVWYQSMESGQVWLRSLREWCEDVEVDGQMQPRFKLIGEASDAAEYGTEIE